MLYEVETLVLSKGLFQFVVAELLFDVVFNCLIAPTDDSWEVDCVSTNTGSLGNFVVGDLGDDDAIFTSKLVTSPLATTVLWLP